MTIKNDKRMAIFGKRLYILLCLLMITQLMNLASASDFTAPIDHTATISYSDLNGYKIELSKSKSVSWSISVKNGANLDICLIDSWLYPDAKNGSQFVYYKDYSAKNTKSLSKTYTKSGSYVLMVLVTQMAYGNSSTYAANITFKDIPQTPQQNSGETNMIIIVGVTALITLPIIFFVIRIFRAPISAPKVQPNTVHQIAICPYCSSNMRFIQQYSQWYCDICGRYSVPIQYR